MGLIGGSIGLAARERIEGAHVRGFNRSPGPIATALEMGVIDEACESIEQAVAESDLCFVCTPVGVLPEMVRRALAGGGDCVVSDVGSTKAALLGSLHESGLAESDLSRFVGGHPLAGAEAAGVEHARADLFDGAIWYLTPTEGASGVHYDRLFRLIADLGARPLALAAKTHDRLVATVSHLPHVLANLLVSQAAAALAEESQSLPATGPSFRDSTRVAGANPQMWRDIFLANRVAIEKELADFAERLDQARAVLRSGDGEQIASWIEAARTDRTHLLESELAGGPVSELRLSVPNEPGVVASVALALGEAGVNIVDMALYPAPDMKSGAIALWVAGRESAERAARSMEKLGYAAVVVTDGGGD